MTKGLFKEISDPYSRILPNLSFLFSHHEKKSIKYFPGHVFIEVEAYSITEGDMTETSPLCSGET